jgi:hypothetical protein
LVGAALLAGLHTFQARYLRPFDNQATLFDGSQLQPAAELAGPGPIRVVHFWDPACPCNVGNQQHLGDLVSQFAGQGVTFHVLQKPGSHGQLPANLAALKPLTSLPGSEHLPASPAVAIWDRQGDLAYFGPYSEGAVCNASNSFIEPILKACSTAARSAPPIPWRWAATALGRADAPAPGYPPPSRPPAHPGSPHCRRRRRRYRQWSPPAG